MDATHVELVLSLTVPVFVMIVQRINMLQVLHASAYLVVLEINQMALKVDVKSALKILTRKVTQCVFPAQLEHTQHQMVQQNVFHVHAVKNITQLQVRATFVLLVNFP